MLNLRSIESLAERIGSLLPPEAGVLREEFRTNVRALLESGLARMDLVTREEFDAQSELLRRTREKLDRLEATLAALEAREPAP
jgi:BMFP domain-containing protein YqiC